MTSREPLTTMRAAIYDPTASPPTLGLVDVPAEVIGPGQVRVVVKAVPVSEFWLSLGRQPFVPGWVFSGVISEVADDVGSRFVGRRVAVMHRTGALAEAAVVPLDAVRRMPNGLGFAEAACSAAGVKASIIADDLLARFGSPEGCRVGVFHDGTFFAAVLAGLLRRSGVEVLGVATAPCTVAHQRAIGFCDAIDRSVEDVVTGLSRLTAGRGVDAVVDHLGTLTLEIAGQVLCAGGTLLRCDPYRRALPASSEATLSHWLERGNTTIEFEGVTAAARQIDQVPERTDEVMRAVLAGDITFVLHTVPFDQVHEALSLLRSGRVAGPVVVTR